MQIQATQNVNNNVKFNAKFVKNNNFSYLWHVTPKEANFKRIANAFTNIHKNHKVEIMRVEPVTKVSNYYYIINHTTGATAKVLSFQSLSSIMASLLYNKGFFDEETYSARIYNELTTDK